MIENQTHIEDILHRFVNERIVPYSTQWDQAESFPKYIWEELGSLGLLGVTVPSQFGGSELGLLEHSIVMEYLSYASPSVALSYIAHSNLCMHTLVNSGSQELKEKYLPDMCTGKKIGALAISEHNAGSDAFSLSLKATSKGEGFMLNGSKLWITNGPIADNFIVYTSTEINKVKGITAFMIERGTEGFEIGSNIQKIGMKASQTSELTFIDCYVSNEQVVGQVNQGLDVLKKGLNSERLLLSSGPLGIIKRSLEDCISYTSSREQFGHPINSFQRIQDKISMIYTHYHSLKTWIRSTAHSIDQGKPLSSEECAAIFLQASGYGIQSADECLQAHGGNGYTMEYGVGQRWVDAKLYDIGGGTKEIRKHLIANKLIKKHT